MKTINCKGTLISLEKPRVMGILNVTPDSFYQKSRVSDKDILICAEKMLKEGADFIDIGGYSSRPGAENVSEKEELQRVIPSISLLIKNFPEIHISVDTFRANVAQESLDAGACIINDISAGELDPNMWEIIRKNQAVYIAMHMKGTPQTMQNMTSYQNLIKDIIFYFSQKKQKAQELGINDFIIDLGFGFSKTLEQNYMLMNHLQDFKILDTPMLVGVSRKSMIYKLLETCPENSLNGTSILHTLALIKGANILRVHDVKEAVECIKIVETTINN